MRLREPCEHGRYDAHYIGDVFLFTNEKPAECPGGEFLPEDAELVERIVEETARLNVSREQAVAVLDVLRSAE